MRSRWIIVAFTLSTATFATGQSQTRMDGYLGVPNGRVDPSFGGGFSMYVAAWPLLDAHPGPQFQTGLFSTWMHAAHHDGEATKHVYSDIEGGLGWWRDTRFPTETPKFIMGGVALEFSAWANGPGAGKGRDWSVPAGKYGVAQLSPWVLWPPDGLNLARGTCGEFFGYGYLPLPLIDAKTQTAGKDVPTGNQCWTLFVNSANFKGPVAFFTPFFFSEPTIERPDLAGRFLDGRPADPNRALQMETQYVPARSADLGPGTRIARVAPVRFPVDENGESILVHRITSYRRAALWDAVSEWFDGGAVASGAIDATESIVHEIPGTGWSTWRIVEPGASHDDSGTIDWQDLATPFAPDSETFGFRWNSKRVTKPTSKPWITLPEYYVSTVERERTSWKPLDDLKSIPVSLREATLAEASPRPEPYVTPNDGCWKDPGPTAGPFEARLGDGSVVTYYWYRFADQPALQNADLTREDRDRLQDRVERLHREWTPERDYLPPPTRGRLAALDDAVLVRPPKGLEVGYVPIVTRQGLPD